MSIETFGESLPVGWEQQSLAAISSQGLFVDGDWVESKDQDPEGGIRLTQLADVGEGEFRNRSDRWMREDQAEKVGVTYLKEGDLLIARMPDPLGRCCQVPKLTTPAVTVVDVAILRLEPDDADSKFVMWMLNSPQIRIEMQRLSSGTTRNRISRKNLCSIQIPVPPLNEQKKIVEILEEQLSRLDAAIASIRAAREKSARFRRSLLHAAFTGALTGHDTSNGTRPKGWKELSLNNACELITDGSHFSPATTETGYPYITVRDLKDSGIDFNNCKFVSGTSYEELTKNGCRPQKDDVLFSKDGTVGKVALIETDIEFVVLSSLAILRPNKSVVNSRFLGLAMQSPVVLESALGMKTGTALRRIVLRNLKTVVINIPPLEEQLKIVEILEEQLSRVDAALALADVIEKKASALRRSLLHTAFSGDLTKEWREAANV
jgi:type I restriction enzyme S subunit